MTAFEDEKRITEIGDEIRNWCLQHGAPFTVNNAVLAMYMLNYADWLGGDDISPTCSAFTDEVSL